MLGKRERERERGVGESRWGTDRKSYEQQIDREIGALSSFGYVCHSRHRHRKRELDPQSKKYMWMTSGRYRRWSIRERERET